MSEKFPPIRILVGRKKEGGGRRRRKKPANEAERIRKKEKEFNEKCGQKKEICAY